MIPGQGAIVKTFLENIHTLWLRSFNRFFAAFCKPTCKEKPFDALVEFGENGRYAIPYQSLLILVVCLWLAAQFQSGKRLAKKILE